MTPAAWLVVGLLAIQMAAASSESMIIEEMFSPTMFCNGDGDMVVLAAAIAYLDAI